MYGIESCFEHQIEYLEGYYTFFWASKPWIDSSIERQGYVQDIALQACLGRSDYTFFYVCCEVPLVFKLAEQPYR